MCGKVGIQTPELVLFLLGFFLHQLEFRKGHPRENKPILLLTSPLLGGEKITLTLLPLVIDLPYGVITEACGRGGNGLFLHFLAHPARVLGDWMRSMVIVLLFNCLERPV